MERYREQLGDVDLVFTSAANHRDWLAKEVVRHPLGANDPGGMIEVKDTLLHLLSTESRLAASARAIHSGAASVLEDMLKIVDDRRRAVHSIKNREEAERKLGTFRHEFGESREEFASKTSEDAALLAKGLAGKSKLADALTENIALIADGVLARYETDDAGRHWRTRRSGHWGYMHALQGQVANAIFPKVANLLQEQQFEFVEFVEKFKAHLGSLADKSHGLAERLELGADIRLDVSERLEGFLKKVLANLQVLIELEEQQIVALLDEFVTDDVSERISEAREAVTEVFGRGTTRSQTSEVRQFYADARSILREALLAHIRARYAEYGAYLEQESIRLPEQAISEVEAELERVQLNITAAAEATIRGQKQAFDRVADELSRQIGVAKSEIGAAFSEHGAQVTKEPTPSSVAMRTGQTVIDSVSEKPVSREPEGPMAESLDALREKATVLRARHKLTRGETNWSFAKIFDSGLIANAQHILVIEPYLTRAHQQRNLLELIEHLRKTCPLRSIFVRTGQPPGHESAELDAALRQIASDLKRLDVELEWDQDRNEHDRFLVLDNGVVFKLGRGLDIYQVVSGLAKKNQDLRRVNECEIDVFVPATP